jgi:serine/threonine-protein kinase
VPPVLDELLARGLHRAMERRMSSAHQMALELAAAIPPAPATEVAAYVAELAEDLLRQRAALVTRVEQAGPTPLPLPRARRPRWIAVAVGSVLIAAASAVGLWLWSRQPLELPGGRLPAPAAEAPPLPESPPVPAVAPPARAAKRSAPPARSPHCTPPFTIDADGHKRYKVECL